MLVLKDLTTTLTAPTIMRVERAAGVPKLVAGLMLLVMVTEAMPNVVALTATPTKVLTPMVTRTLMLMAMAILMLTVMDVMDPALTPALADTADGKLESTDTPTLMLLPKVDLNAVLMAVSGKMPAVTATLPLIPLDVVLADGAQLLKVQLMLLLARMASRSAKRTVAMPKTNTVMHTVVLLHTMVRDMVLEAPEVLLLVAPVMQVLVLVVLEGTILTLVLTAPELEQLVFMAVPMAALEAMELIDRVHLVVMVATLDTVELLVTAEMLATAAIATATAAMATDAVATIEMMVTMEVVIELS